MIEVVISTGSGETFRYQDVTSVSYKVPYGVESRELIEGEKLLRKPVINLDGVVVVYMKRGCSVIASGTAKVFTVQETK